MKHPIDKIEKSQITTIMGPSIEGFFSSKRSLILVLFLIIATIAAGQLAGNELLLKLFIAPPASYFDTGHYLNLAAIPKCWAFYPLWPQVVKFMSAITGLSPVQAANNISQLIFVIVSAASLRWFRKRAHNHAYGHAVWSLYMLSPMTLFLLIGYSEATFALLGWGLIFIVSKACDTEYSAIALSTKKHSVDALHIIAGFVLTLAMSYSRPILPQMLAAVSVVLIIRRIDYRKFRQKKWAFHSLDYFFVVLLAGSAIGYSLYGLQCIAEGKSFIEPFLAQTNDWDKSVGFRPLFLLNPRSPIFDLWGLYYPTILFTFGLACKYPRILKLYFPFYTHNTWFLPAFLVYPPIAIGAAFGKNMFDALRNKKIRLAPSMQENTSQHSLLPLNKEILSSPFFFFCSFSAAHSAIVFLTQENYLYSLGRYIFGQPYFYASLAMAMPFLAKSYNGNLMRIAAAAIGLSSISLTLQFTNFSKGIWAG